MNVTSIITTHQHQRMIAILAERLNPITPKLNEDLLRRIQWHTEQYLAKTGRLPR